MKSTKTKEYVEKGTQISSEKTFKEKYFNTKSIIFGLLWIVFLFQCTQIGNYEAPLATFDPLSILGVTAESEDPEIKAVRTANHLLCGGCGCVGCEWVLVWVHPPPFKHHSVFCFARLIVLLV